MMGRQIPQRTLFYQLPSKRSCRRSIPCARFRVHCGRGDPARLRDLYAPIGRPSIPPEQLFLALVGSL